jgi:two-component system response regulator GlrR
MQRERGDDATTLTTIHRGLVRFPSLVVVATDRNGREVAVPLGVTPVVVGTIPDVELTVDDPAVSRRHCMLTLTGHGVLIRDLHSKNGTSVGGVEVREAYLMSTSFARVGGVTLRLHVVGAPTDIPVWPDPTFGSALGGSVVMRALFRVLHDAAQTDQPILLRGESGTGKGILAEAVHQASPRHEGPFVTFDVASTSAASFEAELFGVARGAYSESDRPGLFDEASGGTLLLDEIGDLSLELQGKLLTALESGQVRPLGSNAWHPFDARIIATTHRDLRAAAAAGEFRSDLLFRLAVIEARIPALRERKDDIELLVERFLAAEQPPRNLLDLPAGALPMLTGHDWPGNVRELKSTLARLVLFPHTGAGPLEFLASDGNVRDRFEGLFDLPWRDAREKMMEEFEARYLAAKLHENGGNVSRTSEKMGISRQLVHRLMVRYGLRGR